MIVSITFDSPRFEERIKETESSLMFCCFFTYIRYIFEFIFFLSIKFE